MRIIFAITAAASAPDDGGGGAIVIIVDVVVLSMLIAQMESFISSIETSAFYPVILMHFFIVCRSLFHILLFDFR